MSILVVIMILFLGTGNVSATDSSSLYLQDAAGMFNERGFYKSNNYNPDGNTSINEFNGNLSYRHMLFQYPLSQDGLNFSLELIYNGGVGHFTYNGNEYKSNINLPEWIISVNGIAVQVLNFENEMVSWETNDLIVENDDVAALINGYHSCYEYLSDRGVGVVSILMGDGSIKEFYNQGTPDCGQNMICGEYLTRSKNDRSKAYVYDENNETYFVMFNDDGTRVVFKMSVPTVVCRPSAISSPDLVNLLPIRFEDNQGHSFRLLYNDDICSSNS